ncbi:acyltransferase family protein [Rhodobacter sp. NSM]|uniref:acyltransferase family protein n=1 Tax=Rhodobacter sp. NSM TaxID=3457501 RepID=UPI003FD085B5
MKRVYPGFDLLRVLAASGVVFSHAFLIMELSETNEPVKAATGAILGIYGVMVFFILSGFLVTDSALRSHGVLDFAEKRARRLLPGFVCANLVVALLICPLFAAAGPAAFLGSEATWQELGRVLLLLDPSLDYPGAVSFFPTAEDNAWLASVANGVLWTIRIEISCYLLVALLMLAGMLTGGAVLAVICVAVFCTFTASFYATDYASCLIYLLPSFLAGMALRLLLPDGPADGRLALASATVLLFLMCKMGNWKEVEGVLFPLFAAYPLVWLGQQEARPLAVIRRFGDPSYGMYLWGWPVQMLLRALVGPGWSGWAFAALSLPVAAAAGYLSWFLLERRFLRGRREGAGRYRVGTGVSPR